MTFKEKIAFAKLTTLKARIRTKKEATSDSLLSPSSPSCPLWAWLMSKENVFRLIRAAAIICGAAAIGTYVREDPIGLPMTFAIISAEASALALFKFFQWKPEDKDGFLWGLLGAFIWCALTSSWFDKVVAEHVEGFFKVVPFAGSKIIDLGFLAVMLMGVSEVFFKSKQGTKSERNE